MDVKETVDVKTAIDNQFEFQSIRGESDGCQWLAIDIDLGIKSIVFDSINSMSAHSGFIRLPI